MHDIAAVVAVVAEIVVVAVVAEIVIVAVSIPLIVHAPPTYQYKQSVCSLVASFSTQNQQYYSKNKNASIENCGYPYTEHCIWSQGEFITITTRHKNLV